MADPTKSGTLYAGLAAYGVYRTTDGGAHWVPFDDHFPLAGNEGWAEALAISPANPSTLYASVIANGVVVLNPMCGDGALDPGEVCEPDGFNVPAVQ